MPVFSRRFRSKSPIIGWTTGGWAVGLQSIPAGLPATGAPMDGWFPGHGGSNMNVPLLRVGRQGNPHLKPAAGWRHEFQPLAHPGRKYSHKCRRYQERLADNGPKYPIIGWKVDAWESTKSGRFGCVAGRELLWVADNPATDARNKETRRWTRPRRPAIPDGFTASTPAILGW